MQKHNIVMEEKNIYINLINMAKRSTGVHLEATTVDFRDELRCQRTVYSLNV